MSTALSPSTPTERTADATERIDALRGEIDACDAQIIELVQRRLSIAREIGALRTASGGMRLSLSREQRVLCRFRAALGPDGATLGMMLLRQGRGRL
ncbi:MAG: Monofunctional chorismate mutase [Modestobacter sp.]|jgi:chorismate mutase|nr:Monofunctional chorismate mutase [Modestobacter sp.]MCW2619458.1 Monofunctional chorismate mutase [Modestobacter sp.]